MPAGLTNVCLPIKIESYSFTSSYTFLPIFKMEREFLIKMLQMSFINALIFKGSFLLIKRRLFFNFFSVLLSYN